MQISKNNLPPYIYSQKKRNGGWGTKADETWGEIIVNFIGLFTVPKMFHAFLT